MKAIDKVLERGLTVLTWNVWFDALGAAEVRQARSLAPPGGGTLAGLCVALLRLPQAQRVVSLATLPRAARIAVAVARPLTAGLARARRRAGRPDG